MKHFEEVYSDSDDLPKSWSATLDFNNKCESEDEYSESDDLLEIWGAVSDSNDGDEFEDMYNGSDGLPESWSATMDFNDECESEDEYSESDGLLQVWGAVSDSDDGDEFEDAYNGFGDLLEVLGSNQDFSDEEEFEDDYTENQFESLLSDYKNEYEEEDVDDDMGNDDGDKIICGSPFKAEGDCEIKDSSEVIENERNFTAFGKNRENYRTEAKPRKLSMQYLERLFLKKIPVREVQGKLFYYDGRCYRKADKNTLKLLLRSELPAEVVEDIPGMSRYQEVVSYIEINPALSLDARTFPYRKEKNYISFHNKVVDAKTLETYRHKHKFPLFFSINADYQKDPEGTPVFDEFLDTVSRGDGKIKTLILEMLGYLFLHSNDAKKFFVLAVAPDSGKSVLMKFLELLFEEESIMHVSLQNMGDKFALTNLPYTAVNIHADLSSEKVNESSVGVVKNLTGDFSVSYDKKFEDPSNTIHHIHLVFCTNTPISLKRQDIAFWNRMVIVPFNYSIPKEKQDDNLVSGLYAERNAIVSRAVRAVSKVIKRNYKFTMPDESRRMWLEWSQNTDDTFRLIMDGLIEVTGNKQDKLSVKDLYGDYVTEGDKNGYYRMQYPEFQKQMKAVYGLEKRKLRLDGKDNPVSCFEGIRLLRGKHTL